VDAPAPRIFLRPIGSPLTIGMSGLAIASLVESGVALKWVPSSEAVQAGLILIAVPFVLQLLASIFSYLARDGAGGAATGVLATTWLALGLSHVSAGTARSTAVLGLLLVAASGVLALSAIAIGVGKPLLAAVFTLAALRFGLAGVYELSGTAFWQDIAGVAGLVVCAGAAYCVLAFELEGQQRRTVLPTLRRGRGQLAMSAAADGQMDGVAHEAGVRQTT
jgi:succinate-acetate transporter protein